MIGRRIVPVIEPTLNQGGTPRFLGGLAERASNRMGQYLIFAPILTLLFLGTIIALRSGAAGTDLAGDVRVIASNFPALFVRVAAFLVAVLLLGYLLNAPSLLHLAGR